MNRFSAAVLALILLATTIPAAADETVDLSQYRGRVVVVDFWASWCVPCRRSFPWLNEMQQRYGDDGLVVIGVNVDNDEQEAQAFLDEYPARFEIVFDRDKTLARKFDVIAMPSSFVIGRDGDTAAKHLGFKVKKQDAYEAAIVAALGEAHE